MAENEVNASQLCHCQKKCTQSVVPGTHPSITLQVIKKPLDGTRRHLREAGLGIRWAETAQSQGIRICHVISARPEPESYSTSK